MLLLLGCERYLERQRHSQGALPLLTWLAPFFSSCLCSSRWTNSRSQRHIPSKAEASEKQSGLRKAPLPLAISTFSALHSRGVSAADETCVLPVPSFMQAPTRRQRRESPLSDASPSCRHTSGFSSCVSQGSSSVSQAASGPVGLPSCFCSRAGRGGAPASIPAGHRVFSFKGSDVWFPRPSLEV